MNTIIYKSSPIQKLVDADEKAGVVKGYGSIFDNLDSDGDIIKKGMVQGLNTYTNIRWTNHLEK